MDRIGADLVADRRLSTHALSLSQLYQVTGLATFVLIAAASFRRLAIFVAKLDRSMGCPACTWSPWLYLDWRELGTLHFLY